MSAWWLLLPLAMLTLLPWAIGVWEDEMTDLKLKRAREAQQAVVDSTDYSEIEKSAQVRVVELEAELTELREAVRDLDEDTFSTNEDYVLGWQDAIHYAKRQLIEEKE